jgi:hypothetical protein
MNAGHPAPNAQGKRLHALNSPARAASQPARAANACKAGVVEQTPISNSYVTLMQQRREARIPVHYAVPHNFGSRMTVIFEAL